MTDEQFLSNLYAGLLGREADSVGFMDHLGALRTQVADPHRYRRLIEAFIQSNEFRLTMDRLSVPRGFNVFLPDMTAVTFGHVVSLGGFCHPAMALKRAGLRAWSCPFDWTFSSLPMVAHAIQDNFKEFLNTRHYRSVALADRVTPEANFCEHDFYRARDGVRFVFNHRDPASVPADAAYYQRATVRLQKVLSSKVWKLFVVVLPGQVKADEIQPLLTALEGATNNFIVLALQFNTVQSLSEDGRLVDAIRTERVRHNLLKVELNVGAPSNGVEFPDAHDNRMLERLLKSFHIKPEPLAP